jgi:hypothetical protein
VSAGTGIETAGLPDVSVNEVADFLGKNRLDFRKKMQELNDAKGGGLLWTRSVARNAKLWTRWAIVRDLFPTHFEDLPEPTALDIFELRRAHLDLGQRVARLEKRKVNAK